MTTAQPKAITFTKEDADNAVLVYTDLDALDSYLDGFNDELPTVELFNEALAEVRKRVLTSARPRFLLIEVRPIP